MYKIKFHQNRLTGFNEAMGLPLDTKNDWVRLAALIPWEKLEKQYADMFPSKTGTVAKPFRLMFGAVIIQKVKGLSDRETVQEIMENPYLQYFLGFPCFVTERPFCPSLLTKFKKRLDAEVVNGMNEAVIQFHKAGRADNGNTKSSKVQKVQKTAQKETCSAIVPFSTGSDGQQYGSKNSISDGQDETTESISRQTAAAEETAGMLPAAERTESTEKTNTGTLILDATCAPQNIAYPQDVNLLNEAREKLDQMIDELCDKEHRKRPRTYRRKAHKDFLNFAKSKKRSGKKIRKAIRQQLQYIRRNRKQINLLTDTGCMLTDKQQEMLGTIDKLEAQQQEMYDKKVHRVADRIVSLSQPHIRPIVRGKATASVEFGAKLEISVDEEGIARLEKVSFDAYNESETLIPAAEAYRERTGHYPERILADKIYRNKKNLNYCKEHGIRLSGAKLGRPAKDKETHKEDKKIEYQDNADRTEVERDFALGKQKYGLGKIMAKLDQTTAVSIALTILVMNIQHILRNFLSFLQAWHFMVLTA